MTRPRWRWSELGLLIVAVGLVAALYVASGIGTSGAVPPDLAVRAALFGGLSLTAHVVVRFLARDADPLFLPIAVALNGLGLVMISRLDNAYRTRAEQAGKLPAAPAAAAQLLWTVLGVVLFALVLLIVRDHRRLQRLTYLSLLAGIGLLLLPLVPGLGIELNGSRIWIRAFGFSFQPGELAKIVLVIFFAGYLAQKKDVLAIVRTRVLGLAMPRARDLGPLITVWLLGLGVLVFQKDLGTAVLFYGVFVVMLYVATQRRSWLVLGGLLLLLGGWGAYHSFGHVAERINVWLNPFADANGTGYQIVQSLYGFAAGGILGTGLGQGRPDLVPFANSDFIGAAIGEELGLFGFTAMVLLYAILVGRGLAAAIVTRDAFGRLLAVGLATTMGLQVFVVLGGVTRLIPLTGLTTPFLAAGGSSLVCNWMVIALLIRVSDAARRRAYPSPDAADALAPSSTLVSAPSAAGRP